jgi:hypothetical protein
MPPHFMSDLCGALIATQKGAAIWFFREELMRMCKKSSSYQVFARALSHDGLKLLQKYKFRQIDQSEPELGKVCSKVLDPSEM